MSQTNIAVIVGSLRRDSFNAKLVTGIGKLAPPDFTFKPAQIGDLPLYNQDDDAGQAPQVKRLKAEIAAAHVLECPHRCDGIADLKHASRNLGGDSPGHRDHPVVEGVDRAIASRGGDSRERTRHRPSALELAVGGQAPGMD